MSANLSAILYLVSGVLFILALRGLSSPETSRQGNLFGIIGMVIAITVTFLSVGNFSSGFIYVLIFLAIGGSIGAFIDCVSGKDPFKPSGKKICTKLSMKVKINWKQREQKFYDLTKLQFHSQNNDPSQMRERLGYWLFRSMGVPAPRSVHAQLKINGTSVSYTHLTLPTKA